VLHKELYYLMNVARLEANMAEFKAIEDKIILANN
jgi:hypothetical protein